MKAPFYLSAIALTASLTVAQDEVSVPQEAFVPVATPVAESATDTVAEAAAPAVETASDSVAAPSAETAAEPTAEQVAETAEPVAEQPAEPATEQVVEANVAETNVTEAKEVVANEAATKLSGNLQGFLKADASPYSIESNVFVEKNAVLVIEPGVVLQFAPGAGLYVEGQLVIAGTGLHKVTLEPYGESKNANWKGVFISSDKENEIRNAVVSGAENGIVVENGSLSMQSSSVSKTTSRGIYAKNSKLNISDCTFEENQGIALHVSSYSIADIQRSSFTKNNVALENDLLAQTDVSSSNFENNSYGILDMGNSLLTFDNTKVNKNKNGAASKEILDNSVLESVDANETNFSSDYQAIASVLPPNPEIPGVTSRSVNPNDQIINIAKANKSATAANTEKKSWSVIGNVMLGDYYHKVLTRHNHKKESVVAYNDTIKPGERYKNLFQTPGFGTEISTYLLMQLPNGGTLEFDANLTSDSWNHIAPNPISLTYTDKYNKAILGDFQKINGDIYMSALPVFGADYTLSLLKNNGDQPMFEIEAMIGEAQRSLVPGERHPDMYNNLIEYGEAQAQRQVVGGSVKWSPVRRFDAKFGVLYANDEIEDPFFRKGTKATNITSEPLQESFTMYADGNWLFYPGDIELNGQVAIGRADTAEVFVERAINQVFQEAGVNYATYNDIRQLMANETEINRLTSAELEEIFGDNTTMTRSQMRDSLKTLIKNAKKARKDAADASDDEKVLGMRWSGQNLAVGASLFWNINKTTIAGHLKYVGENYFSAGSADLLADTREFGGNIEQIISKFWTLNFGYQINVENAASEDKANIFGLGEGTTLGFFGSASDSWKKEHELDNDRAKYIQNFNLSNKVKINENVDVNVAYNLEYRTQYRPFRIHGVFALSEEIYKDSWFKKRKGKETLIIYHDGDSTKVDKDRWQEYMEMSTEPYLGSEFQERIFKHSLKGDVSVRKLKSLFKVGGAWVLRTDHSKFHNDSLMKKFDFSNKTWGKMGYYFEGADYFEQSYPISITSTLPSLQNKIAVTPRFKSYERDDMFETEVAVEDEIEVPLMNRFMVLGANGTFRYLTTSWKQNGEKSGEDEIDVLGNVNLLINHTKRLNTEWYAGAAMYYRPDNLFNEYKDIFGGVRVNYAF